MLNRIKRRFRVTTLLPVLVIAAALFVAGCASSAGGSGASRGDAGNSPDRILACKSTDRQVDSQTQCLLDDAACYQISNGQWCTGERGSVCPAGSVALATGEACPAGSRCFRVGESLECRI